MPRIKEVVEEIKKEEPILTEKEIMEGVTNNQIFNPDEVVLNNKIYKIKHLEYDDFTVFTSYFEPMVRKVLVGLNNVKNTSEKGETKKISIADLDVIDLIKSCGDNLPYMGQIILKQTDPNITLEETKKVCGDPFTICELVLLQMNKNRMVEKFSTFFPQLMSLMSL